MDDFFEISRNKYVGCRRKNREAKKQIHRRRSVERFVHEDFVMKGGVGTRSK